MISFLYRQLDGLSREASALQPQILEFDDRVLRVNEALHLGMQAF
jgi:hypothetical protein